MPSCGVATSDVQTDQGKAVTRKDPGPETASCDIQDATMLVGGGGSEIAVGAKFDSFVTFRQCFEAWCAEGRHVVSISNSHKNITPDLREEFKYSRVVYKCVHGATVRPRGTGKRNNQSYNGTGCGMCVKVALASKRTFHYVVTEVEAAHNHDLHLYSLYPQNRLLTSEEQAQVVNLQNLGVPSRKIREQVKNMTGKTVKTKDLNNISQRHSIPIHNDAAHGEMFVKKIESLIAKDPNFTVHYEKNKVLCVHPFSFQLGYIMPQHFGSGRAASALTFYARLPKGVTNVELTKILVQTFSRQELSGVQDFGAGRFEIFFKSKSVVERFLNNPAITVREQDVRFDYRGSQAKAIRMLHYPNDQPDEALCRALGSLGRMRVDMNKAVPNLVAVGRFTVQCECKGVVRLCIRCGLPGHYAAACTTPKCKRCDRFGHEQCEAPCIKCAGDHAVSECTFRSFAMVTQQPPPPAGAVSTSVAPVQQDSSSSTQASGAGSMQPEGDGGLREDQLAASPPEQSAPAAAAATEDQAEEELRPRHKRKSHTLAAGTSANNGSEDELSRSSRDTPKEKRAAVDGNESSGDEGSGSSEETSADSYSSESGDAIENPPMALELRRAPRSRDDGKLTCSRT
ncbi:hypothetical protein HPB48_015779 [Haemaphysalis longicornis]|uniref:CCHC-type domain-containing protein n=1 Tax=Haemaphysalis longicornis TaxID=44386 RepID=A0A9J6G9R4_HAELO|nr:hypothetical protein HPB48_015779 [Haemaphysalis longicornis]